MQSSLIDSIRGMNTIPGEAFNSLKSRFARLSLVGLLVFLGDIMREHAHCFPSVHLTTEVEHLGALKSGDNHAIMLGVSISPPLVCSFTDRGSYFNLR